MFTATALKKLDSKPSNRKDDVDDSALNKKTVDAFITIKSSIQGMQVSPALKNNLSTFMDDLIQIISSKDVLIASFDRYSSMFNDTLKQFTELLSKLQKYDAFAKPSGITNPKLLTVDFDIYTKHVKDIALALAEFRRLRDALMTQEAICRANAPTLLRLSTLLANADETLRSISEVDLSKHVIAREKVVGEVVNNTQFTAVSTAYSTAKKAISSACNPAIVVADFNQQCDDFTKCDASNTTRTGYQDGIKRAERVAETYVKALQVKVATEKEIAAQKAAQTQSPANQAQVRQQAVAGLQRNSLTPSVPKAPQAAVPTGVVSSQQASMKL